MLFERHVGFPTEKIKLNQYSMNPQEVENWIWQQDCQIQVRRQNDQEEDVYFYTSV